MIVRGYRIGLVGAGNSGQRWTGRIEQTGPLELTVRAGTFIGSADEHLPDGSVRGRRVEVAIPETVVPIVPDPDYPMQIELRALPSGDLQLLCNVMQPDNIMPVGAPVVLEPPLIWWKTAIPAGCTDLADVPIYTTGIVQGWLTMVDGEVYVGQPQLDEAGQYVLDEMGQPVILPQVPLASVPWEEVI